MSQSNATKEPPISKAAWDDLVRERNKLIRTVREKDDALQEEVREKNALQEEVREKDDALQEEVREKNALQEEVREKNRIIKKLQKQVVFSWSSFKVRERDFLKNSKRFCILSSAILKLALRF